MIIGIDASRADAEQKTGVEWYAFHIIEQLKKQLPDTVRVVLYSDKPLQGELAELPSHWESKVLSWSPKRFWTQIRLSLEMMMHPPDVLFVPAHVMPLVHPGKTVVTVHDVAAKAFPESYSRFEQWYTLWSARFALNRAWQIIVPSDFTKQELLSLSDESHDEQIQVIHHGFNTVFSPIDNQLTIKKVLNTYGIQKPYLLSIGRLETKKNTRRIIEAFHILKQRPEHSDLQLVLVGKPGHGYGAVEKRLSGSSFKDDIIRPGWVSQDDLPALMNGASVFVFPSLYEGFGIPVLEALACGTAVVTSQASSLPEVGGTVVMAVDPLSSQAIADGIAEVLEEGVGDDVIRKRIDHAQQFSWVKAGEETARVLRR